MQNAWCDESPAHSTRFNQGGASTAPAAPVTPTTPATPATTPPLCGADPAAAHAVPHFVRLEAEGDPANVRALAQSLGAWLGRLGLALEPTSTSAEPLPEEARLATAHVEFHGTVAATLTVVVIRTGKEVLRSTVPSARTSAILVEEVAQILHGTLEEVTEADSASRACIPAPAKPVAPATTPATTPVTPAPTPTELEAPQALATQVYTAHKTAEIANLGPRKSAPSWTADAQGFVAARAFGPSAKVVLGGGAAVGFTTGQSAFSPTLRILCTMHVPFDASSQILDGHFTALTWRVAPTFAILRRKTLRLEAGPQLGFDALFASSRSSMVPDNRRAGPSTDLSPTLGAALWFRSAIANGADVFVAASADVDLASNSYLTRVGNETTVVFEPYPIRPALSVGFTYAFAGAEPYPAREVVR